MSIYVYIYVYVFVMVDLSDGPMGCVNFFRFFIFVTWGDSWTVLLYDYPLLTVFINFMIGIICMFV